MITPSVTGSATVDTFSSSVSSTHTVTTHTFPVVNNGMLVLFVNNRLFDSVSPALASATWDGQALSSQVNTSSGKASVCVWTLKNPHSGNKNLVITWLGPPNAGMISVVNVQDAGVVDAKSSDSHNGSASSAVTDTTNFDNELVLSSCYDVNEPATSYGAGQTQITNHAGGSGFHQATSWKEAATAGSTTMTTTFDHATDSDVTFLSITAGDSFVPTIINVI